LLLESFGGWDPTGLLTGHLGLVSEKTHCIHDGCKPENHPTLTAQDTHNWASLAQVVSHKYLFTLPIIGRRGHMVARHLKLQEGLIKPGPWRMQTQSTSGSTNESGCW
jgi:hypothetical protein